MPDLPWLDHFLRSCATPEELARADLDPAALPSDDAALELTLRTHARGIPALSSSERLLQSAVRYVALSMRALGPLEPLLRDATIEEVALNSPRPIWVRRRGTFEPAPLGFYDDDHVRRILERLCGNARGSQRQLDPARGVQDFTLADGSRLHVVHPELTPSGSWLVNLRRPFSGLCDVLEVPRILEAAVRAGATVVIAGSPGSGKTTLARSLLSTLGPQVRIVVVEEVGETRVDHPNTAHLQTREARPGTESVSLRTLVAASLRMSPGRLVVGEVRDAEALPFVLAAASGIPGMTTIHARDPRGALERLALLASLAPSGPPQAVVRQLVAESTDVVVYLTWREGPHIEALAAVEGIGGSDGAGPFVLTDLLQSPLAHSTRLARRFPHLVHLTSELP